MKPIQLTTCNDRRLDSFDRVVGKRCPPITDYSYHSGGFHGSSAHYVPVHTRSFWNIAGEYFKHEARYDFRSEAALFALITITAALPLINNLHALIEFVRATTFY
ncbi:MAG: hypothetical protein WAN04_04255 [Candidatus Udaeobacter sp.]